MKTIFLSLINILLLFSPLAMSTENERQQIEGEWVTIDDDTKKEKSIVLLSIKNGVLSGKVVKLLNPDPKKPKTCDKCKGDRKNLMIEGMEILRGMTYEDGEWSGGKILDPSTGKEYKCNMSLDDQGKQLKVRGYIGFSLIGRTQYWKKK